VAAAPVRSAHTVLVVGDEADIGFALSLSLTRHGWQVRTAADGRRGST